MYDTNTRIEADTKGHIVRYADGQIQVYIGSGSWSVSNAAAVVYTYEQFINDAIGGDNTCVVTFVPLAEQ